MKRNPTVLAAAALFLFCLAMAVINTREAARLNAEADAVTSGR